jgi:hypothetical protein
MSAISHASPPPANTSDWFWTIRFFQPLRELSQFIVLIDEALDRKEAPILSEEAEQLLKQARLMLVPAEEGSGFARRYFEIMQRDPATVLAHRDMLQVLGSI